MVDREHVFDHKENVAAHSPFCWCVVWEQRVREAAARNRKITDTEPDDPEVEPWWKR